MHTEYLPKKVVKRKENLKDVDLGKLIGPNREIVRGNNVYLAGSEWRRLANFYDCVVSVYVSYEQEIY
jgi:hypothetical protein